MRNFAKSVLNYFATYTETRFRFDKRNLAYQWLDGQQLDMGVLDFAVFPEVQWHILDCIAANRPVEVGIKKGKHVIRLTGKPLADRLLEYIEKDGHAEALEVLLKEYGFYAQIKPLPANAVVTDLFELPVNHRNAWLESCRQYNLRLRKVYASKLNAISDAKRAALRAELRIDRLPLLSLNARQEEQKFFDDLQQMATKCKTSTDYIGAVQGYVQGSISDFVLYDLFLVLTAYLQSGWSQSLYLFFHEIGGEGQQRYPLFCAEVQGAVSGEEVTIRSARNVFMLNTPAVNSFEFDNVLTTPRACLFEEASQSLHPIEQFLQAKYSLPDPFLLSHGFSPIVKEKLPDIRFRVALQTVGEEDRRILDYSGLLTSLDEGAGRKFIDMVGQYVGGNVKDTTDEVARAYDQRYPQKSVSRLIHPASQIPLSLNEPQKRILLAAENPANRFLVVDGPPGTGKSHTITALIYQATLMGKSVLVTSHKQQALDVIDNALIEQFKSVHPNSKPPVLRLTSLAARGTRTPNDLQNTLSNPVISAASQRFLSGNPEAVAKDRESLLGKIEAGNEAFWSNADTYPQFINDTFELAKLHAALFGENADPDSVVVARLSPSDSIDVGALARIAISFAGVQCKMPLKALAYLSERRHEMPELLKRCNLLHSTRNALDPSLVFLNAPVPEEASAFSSLLEVLAVACRPELPLPCANNSVVTIPAETCFDLEGVHTYGELCDVIEALQAIASHEQKFLGRLRRDPQVEQRRQELESRFPSVELLAKGSSATDVLKAYKDAKDRIDAVCSQVPWIKPDYFLGGHKTLSPASFAEQFQKLSSLEYHGVSVLLAKTSGCELMRVPLKDLQAKLTALLQIKDYCAMIDGLEPVAQAAAISISDLPTLYLFITAAATLLTELTVGDIAILSDLFRVYTPVLSAVGSVPDDLRSLGMFASAVGKPAQAMRYIALHAMISRHQDMRAPSRQAIEAFYAKTHKLLDHFMDGRFKGFQNFSGTVQRIIIAMMSGQRISEEEARVLFNNLTCVIAEPGQISRHLPMTADLVDYLIIDEASQVSIADSISLMLRAKQVIVFGDELQYGAVAAMNVSERYASQYFKDILRDYALDMNQALSDQERDEIAREASRNQSEEDEQSSPHYEVQPNTREWLKTFSVRTSTLSFARAMKNYSGSLNIHFRSFPEIISYSNEFFYRISQIDLVPNRIRTKPIAEVLRFLPVTTKGNSGRNINLDEIDAVKVDLERLHAEGFKGTIGVICSFKEQTARMEETLRKELAFHTELERSHRFRVWFVGDVQGEERDLIYYSFVQDKARDNADLVSIYPKVGGTADNIRCLKMQRLNVGFSRAKDTMVFVHSMPVSGYSDTRLGEALKHYANICAETHDLYVSDETIFDSPAEKNLYLLLTQSRFFQNHKSQLRLVAQFEIGKYIRQEFRKCIPAYRVDFLLTLSGNGKEKSVIIEYDGVEYHTNNPDIVTAHNFEQEYLEYDVQRQLELESFGYTFLRINKFTLLPRRHGETPADVLNELLERTFL